MRIAIIGSENFDSLEYHLHDELTFQKNECKIFDYKKLLPGKYDLGASQFSMKYVEWKNKNVLSKILHYNPELVIGTYRNIHPFVVREIKNHKIKIIHLNPDALTTFQNQQLFVETYDAYFSKDPYIVNFMKNKLNLNVFLYHEAFNSRLHQSPGEDYKKMENELQVDLLAFGNLYPYRNRMLKIIKESGINISLYGYKSKYFDPYLTDNFQNKSIYGEEKVKVLNGAKIVFNNLHYAEIQSVNKKFFEITGSGAFQVCDYTPLLNELLPIDPLQVSFKSIDDAIILIKKHMENPEKRWEIRKILTAHFQENFTYNNLLKHVFSKI